jgi:hypothetical protein
MNVKLQSRLTNLNKLLVFVLSLGSLLMDGLQSDDIPCISALYIWLWMPFFTHQQVLFLHWIERMKSNSTPSLPPKPSSDKSM